LISGCVEKKGNTGAHDEYMKFYNANVEDDKKCDAFQKSLHHYIDQSSQNWHFVKDEAKAIESMDRFSLEFTSSRRYLRASELLYRDCSSDKPQAYVIGCPSNIDTMVYFENLLFAAKTYPWKKHTKDRAVKLAGDFVRYQLNEPHNLVGTIVIAEVVRQLSLNGFLKRNIAPEINNVLKELDDIRTKRLAEGVKGSCENFLKAHLEEQEIGRTFTERMKSWENALP
jgi:hypothetical protein